MPSSTQNIDIKQPYQQIDYDDAGTNYRGYAKRLKGTAYELLRQSENSIAVGIGINLAGLPAGTYNLNRGHIGQNFIIKYAEVSYIQAGILQEVSFDDPDTSNSFSFSLPTSTGNMIGWEIVPKLFASNIITLVISAAVPINEFISVRLYGWYEDK